VGAWGGARVCGWGRAPSGYACARRSSVFDAPPAALCKPQHARANSPSFYPLAHPRARRDRNLHISAGYVAASSGPGGPARAAEVTSLAAVLTQQHLPMHYRVTREGGRDV
jgi:hypothetical protein